MGVFSGQPPVNPSRTITASTTITQYDHTVLVDTTAGDVVITMPVAATLPNYEFFIKKISTDTNIMSILPTPPDTIDNQTSKATRSTTKPSYTPKSDGVSNWNLH